MCHNGSPGVACGKTAVMVFSCEVVADHGEANAHVTPAHHARFEKNFFVSNPIKGLRFASQSKLSHLKTPEPRLD